MQKKLNSAHIYIDCLANEDKKYKAVFRAKF